MRADHTKLNIAGHVDRMRRQVHRLIKDLVADAVESGDSATMSPPADRPTTTCMRRPPLPTCPPMRR